MRIGAMMGLAIAMVVVVGAGCQKEEGASAGKEPAKAEAGAAGEDGARSLTVAARKDTVAARKDTGTGTAQKDPTGTGTGTAQKDPTGTGTAQKDPTGTGTATTTATGTGEGGMGEEIKAAIPFLPDYLLALLAADPKTAWTQVLQLVPMGNVSDLASNAKLLAELGTFTKSRIGFDPFAVEFGLVFISARQYGGGLVKGNLKVEATATTMEKEIEGTKVFEHNGDPKFYVVPLEGFGMAVFGAEGDVAKFIEDVIKRKPPEKPETPALVATLLEHPQALVSFTIDVKHPLLTAAWNSGVPFPAPEKITLFMTPDETIGIMEGSKESLDGLTAIIEKGRAEALAVIAAERAKLESLDLLEGLAVIAGDNLAGPTIDSLMPKREEGKLVFRIPFRQWGSLSVVGVLAAVAVPAFIKYQKKAKSSEAVDMIDKMRKGAADYYSSPRVDQNGERIPAQFPPSQAATPTAGTCCGSLGGPDADGDGRCDPNPAIWESETWSALKFQVTDPHYFVYAFESNGKTGSEAEFTASAYGDLDCDGIQSTFRGTGRGKCEGTDCWMEFGEFFTEQETE
jgi:hypothetical protein